MEAIQTYRKPSYRREVERLLRSYPVLKVAVELERQADAAGIGFFPSCVPVYEERVSGGYSEYQSSTERYAIRRATKVMELRRIEKALEALNLMERFLIAERYFDPADPPDTLVYDRLGWSERNYYRVKAEAIRKLAEVLGLI